MHVHLRLCKGSIHWQLNQSLVSVFVQLHDCSRGIDRWMMSEEHLMKIAEMKKRDEKANFDDEDDDDNDDDDDDDDDDDGNDNDDDDDNGVLFIL